MGSMLHAADYAQKVRDLLAKGINEQQEGVINVVRLPMPANGEDISITEDVVRVFLENKGYNIYTSVVSRMITEQGVKNTEGPFFCFYPLIQEGWDRKKYRSPQECKTGGKARVSYIMPNNSFQYLKDKKFVVGIMEGFGMESPVEQAAASIGKKVNFIPPKSFVQSYFKWLLLSATALGGGFLAWAIKSGYFSNYFSSVADAKQ